MDRHDRALGEHGPTVNTQSMLAFSAWRRRSQAASCLMSVALSGIRRSPAGQTTARYQVLGDAGRRSSWVARPRDRTPGSRDRSAARELQRDDPGPARQARVVALVGERGTAA